MLLPMDLDQQIQSLIQNAPAEANIAAAVRAIAPALQEVARQLRHLQYYILQNLEEQWVMTTLSHRTQPDVVQTVIHAFPTLKDAFSGPYTNRDPQLMAVPMPVIHILFQMVAMPTLDSIIFFEIPGDHSTGIEVCRQDIQRLIQQSLQPTQVPRVIPPDLA